MIIPIKHKAHRELIHQKKKMQSNKYNTHENSKIVDHDQKVGDMVILTNKYAKRYEMPYMAHL